MKIKKYWKQFLLFNIKLKYCYKYISKSNFLSILFLYHKEINHSSLIFNSKKIK